MALSLTYVDDVEVVPVGEVELGVVRREAEDLLAVAVARRRRALPHAARNRGFFSANSRQPSSGG